MKRTNEPEFDWNPDTGEATCVLTAYDGNVFYGIAKCHPDDADFMSEKTGCDLAYRRAKIKMFQFYKEHQLKPELEVLKQLYYSMNKSKYFNPKSYENKMLQRKIREKEFDIKEIKNLIEVTKQDIKERIKDKDTFYQLIREHRNGKANS